MPGAGSTKAQVTGKVGEKPADGFCSQSSLARKRNTALQQDLHICFFTYEALSTIVVVNGYP
jgi:hypothetical protein